MAKRVETQDVADVASKLLESEKRKLLRAKLNFKKILKPAKRSSMPILRGSLRKS
jgi:hypothetical protein